MGGHCHLVGESHRRHAEVGVGGMIRARAAMSCSAPTTAKARSPRLMPSFSKPSTIPAAAVVSAAETLSPSTLPRKSSANSPLVRKAGYVAWKPSESAMWFARSDSDMPPSTASTHSLSRSVPGAWPSIATDSPIRPVLVSAVAIFWYSLISSFKFRRGRICSNRPQTRHASINKTPRTAFVVLSN